MNAMAVPPPAWVPIGAREIQSLARRYLRQGLLLSSLCHFVLLAAVLYAVSRHRADDLVTFSRAIIVDPAPPPPVILPPVGWTTPAAPEPKDGTIDPTPMTPPEIDFPVNPIVGGSHDPAAPGGAVAPGPAPVATPGEPPDPGENDFQFYDDPPVAIARVLPAYPEWAREAGISGTVVLHALVGADGRVKRITVIRDISGLTASARDAVSRWVFRPARANGHSIPVWVEVPIEFKL